MGGKNSWSAMLGVTRCGGAGHKGSERAWFTGTENYRWERGADLSAGRHAGADKRPCGTTSWQDPQNGW